MMNYFNKVNEVAGNYEYVNNQYENHNGGKFEYREMVKARYVESQNTDYKGNPLIEALPVSGNIQQTIESIENITPYSVDERELRSDVRLDKIEALDELFIFQLQHADIASKINRAMRNGYLGRDIPTIETLNELGLEREDLQYLNFKGGDETFIPSGIKKESIPSPKGFAIIGASGSGKTNTIRRILVNYPRLILHNEVKGEKILFKQVPWVKIEGTYSRSLKGIGLSFFKQLDDVIGTNYEDRFKRLSIDEQISKMQELSVRHQIGLFVFDEVQYINQNTKYEVINYLNKLHNGLPIPIVYIGTYSLYTWMQNAPYTLVRRMEGSGIEEWNRMKNDGEFKNFLTQLWHYQWIKNPSKLTDEMIQAFYDNSMGLTERVVRLFQLCQMTAIEMDVESFSVQDVASCATEMPFTSEIIRALKDNDYTKLEKLDGMMKVDLNNIVKMKRKTVQERVSEREVVESLVDDEYLEEKKLKSELMSYALQLNFDKQMVDNAIRIVSKGKNKRRSIKILKQEMIQLLFSMTTEKEMDKQAVPSETAMDKTRSQRMKVQANMI